MPTVGEQLRAAREQQKLTVHQVADATKIKTDHIRALENSDWSAFSAPVYIRGFVRSYSGYLRLDVKRLMDELQAELRQTKDFAAPPSLTGRRKGPLDFIMLQLSKVKWQIVFPVIVVLAVVAGLVVGVRAWKTQQKKDPYQNLGSGIRQAAGAPAVRSNPPPVQPGVQAHANPAVRTPVRTTLPLPTNAPAPRR